MLFDQIAVTSHTAASLLFIVLALFFYRPSRDGIYSPLFILASLITACWHISLPVISDGAHPTVLTQIFSSLHYASWITALLATLLLNIQDQAAKKNLAPFYTVLFILTILGAIVSPLLINKQWLHSDSLLIWTNLLLALLGLIVVEQVFRNTLDRQKQAVTFLCIGSCLFFLFDIVTYSHALLFNSVNNTVGEARSIINLVAAICLIFATTRSSQSTTVSISRKIVFYSASLIGSGVFLFAMAASGYYVKLFGGSWGSILQAIFISCSLLVLIVTFASTRLRASVHVFINKHFFMHKYDYRMEWLNLITVLSQSTADKEAHTIALEAVSAIFHSNAAGLWLGNESNYQFVASLGDGLENMPNVSANSELCRTLTSEWVFHPAGRSRSSQVHNAKLPEWVHTIDSIWIVLPLLTQQKLFGFMVLRKTHNRSALTWEDLDVVKTVGRQIGSYLALNTAADQLAQSKQFDTYNKLTAFIMHDLKNLIAQQALVVENAKKHKENPAFIEDAIKTIENSVSRMSNLLSKMQQREPSTSRTLELKKILVEAVNKCRDKKPAPSLRMMDSDMRIVGDHDHLVMIFSHVIKNSQEATPPSGFVDVYIQQEKNQALIIIEDNGQGMNDEFIKERLFKPFDTTKSGQGMGIGVFQTREYIQNLGGHVNVESTLGSGTTFTIVIPTVSELVKNGR